MHAELESPARRENFGTYRNLISFIEFH
jgi:hypothetical protein